MKIWAKVSSVVRQKSAQKRNSFLRHCLLFELMERQDCRLKYWNKKEKKNKKTQHSNVHRLKILSNSLQKDIVLPKKTDRPSHKSGNQVIL